MPSETSLLFQNLHHVLQKLEQAEHALAEAPRRIKLAERRIAECEQQIEQQKTKIRERRRAADESNLRLRTQETDIQKLQGVLNQASSNKEYDIVRGQIATSVSRREATEDLAIQALEEVDGATAELETLQQLLATRKADLAQAQAQAAEEQPGLQAAVDECRAELAEIDKHMPSSESRIVLVRLRSAHGASACAAVDDEGFCSACNNKVTTQDGVRINMGEFICCRACGRILYMC